VKKVSEPNWTMSNRKWVCTKLGQSIAGIARISSFFNNVYNVINIDI